MTIAAGASGGAPTAAPLPAPARAARSPLDVRRALLPLAIAAGYALALALLADVALKVF